MKILKVLRTNPNAVIPSRKRNTDSCFDLYAVEDVRLNDGETAVVDLGIKMSIPEGYEFRIYERSGLSTKGISVGAGVVDEEYRGSVKVVLRFSKPSKTAVKDWFNVSSGDRIAQGRLELRVDQSIEEVTDEEFSEDTTRGIGGFGSSGQ